MVINNKTKIDRIKNLIFPNNNKIKEMNIKKYIEIDMGIFITKDNIIKQITLTTKTLLIYLIFYLQKWSKALKIKDKKNKRMRMSSTIHIILLNRNKIIL